LNHYLNEIKKYKLKLNLANTDKIKGGRTLM